MQALNSETLRSWFSTSELLEYFGMSKSDLEERCSLFVEGIHFRLEDPNDSKSQTLWRIDLIDELLCLPVPPLEREAMLNAVKEKITCKR